MKKSERLLAEKYLLQCIFEEDPDFVDKTMEQFGVARSTVYNYINALQASGELERVGGHMPYRITYRTTRFTIDTSREHSEDRLYQRDIAPLLEDLPQNVQKIWRYAITAMLNNAIEHAHASAIVLVVSQNRLCTIVGILDNGVGIFRRIGQEVREQTGDIITVEEAMERLYSGGYTTDATSHGGAGIFFTSHLMDHFAIRSDLHLFTPNPEDVEEESGERFRGTAVQMALANDSSRELSEVLSRFTDAEKGFVRTEIPVFCFFGGAFPVSRSEARRLDHTLTRFLSVELDFSGVEEIGPDFAHEFFSVLQKKNPDRRITVKHAGEAVLAAIRRAES